MLETRRGKCSPVDERRGGVVSYPETASGSHYSSAPTAGAVVSMKDPRTLPDTALCWDA